MLDRAPMSGDLAEDQSALSLLSPYYTMRFKFNLYYTLFSIWNKVLRGPYSNAMHFFFLKKCLACWYY